MFSFLCFSDSVFFITMHSTIRFIVDVVVVFELEVDWLVDDDVVVVVVVVG